MASISGFVYMAVGAGVSLFTRFIQKKGGEGLDLFFWAGIIMIGIGVFKILVRYIFRDKSRNEEVAEKKPFFNFSVNKDLEGVDAQQVQKERQQAFSQMQKTNIILCAACGTKHYSNSNFCHMCGTRLR